MSGSSTGWRHVPQLDAIRASAILIVMVSHAGLDYIVPGGFGVTIFFFLSGYLITSLLRLEASSTGRVDLKGFYLRRTVRIIPPLLLAVALVLALQAAALVPRWFTPGGLVVDLLFLTNYADVFGARPAVQIPLWSLDVEEHFYIGFSIAFALFLARRSPRAAAAACAVACAFVLGLRFLHVLAGSDLDLIFYWSHTRLDSILFGCILALWNNPLMDERAYRPGYVSLAAAAALLLAGFLVRDEVFRQTLRYTVHGIALFILFSWVLQLDRRWDRLFALWPVRWLGLLSYTLYLIHVPLLLTAERLGLTPAWLWAYLPAVALALASYLVIERPFARWRRRFEKHLIERARHTATP